MFEVEKAFTIDWPDESLREQVQLAIDNKTKPIGALGVLEAVAVQVALVQQTLHPILNKPHMLLFAGDHGVVEEGVSPYPQVVTQQMVRNFAHGGAAINVFCRQHGITIDVVDAGINGDVTDLPIVHAKVAYGTRNFLHEPAMTDVACEQAMMRAAALVQARHEAGCNVIALGEMGIGNTSSASAIFSALSSVPVQDCIGRGTGLDDAGLSRKQSVLQAAMQHHAVDGRDAFRVLCTFGGYEIAMMCGALLAACERRMLVVIDGFISTSAAAIALALVPQARAYCVFSHLSDETAHAAMLTYLGVRPLVSLGMRLGEGSGAAVAYPLLVSAVSFLREMASFESATVSTADQ